MPPNDPLDRTTRFASVSSGREIERRLSGPGNEQLSHEAYSEVSQICRCFLYCSNDLRLSSKYGEWSILDGLFSCSPASTTRGLKAHRTGSQSKEFPPKSKMSIAPELVSPADFGMLPAGSPRPFRKPASRPGSQPILRILSTL
jgi:hypothetical protein